MEAESRERNVTRPGVRQDLQGLRGLGVILVVFGHLFRTPPGIFSALDMFFVLSGFLITGILIDTYERMGRLYFVPFYLNRVRRVMPMATTVILVTVGLYYLVFSPARGQQVTTDGLWAFLCAVNWHFTLQGTNYFSEESQSPFLHYWSLSVEEQFYLVWPLLLLVALIAAGRSRRPRAVLIGVLGLVTVGSFTYSMWHSVADPTAAYYSTFDRAWEFGIGGLIAAARPLFGRLPQWAGRTLAWGGLLGLALPIFLLRYGDPFPAPWALTSVLLTGAIIVGGIDRSTRHLFLLQNRPMVYIGDMSYSVYLWHVPIMLLLRPFIAPDTTSYYVAVVALIAILSPLSYHLIERPMRHASWLMTAPERRRLATRPRRDYTRVRQGWVAVGAVVPALFVVGTLTSSQTPDSSAADTQLLPLQEERQGQRQPRGLLAQQQARLDQALARTAFPTFDPPLKRLGTQQWIKDQLRSGCVSVSAANVEDCRFGGATATKRAVVVGESIAVAWMPGIRAALEPRGWSVQQLTLLECGTWRLPSYVHPDGTPYPECKEHAKLVEQYVLREKPDLVILASAAAQVGNMKRPGYPSDGALLAQRGLARTLAALSPSGARMVVLAPPGGSANLLDCVTRFGSPADCVTQPGDYRDLHVAGESAAAAHASAGYIDTLDWFCVDAYCPGFVGRTPVMVDGGHLSLQYSRQLAPLLRQSLLGAHAAKKTN